MTSKFENKVSLESIHILKEEKVRKTGQFMMPLIKPKIADQKYDIYPSFHLDEGRVYEGIGTLADYIVEKKTVLIDGFVGVLWDKWEEEIRNALPEDLKINIQKTDEWFLPEHKIERLVTPYLGESESVWGTKCDKDLQDFFEEEKIKSCEVDPGANINIVLGTGAALCQWDAPVIYFDLPKNELQYRMRAGSITNLGSREAKDPTQMYKRFYFVDWVVLQKHKESLLNVLDVVVDSQRMNSITWVRFKDIKKALKSMSENVFRARPWFEPGIWGGQWIKDRIEGVNKEEVNYAWSFELITPENGLILEKDGLLAEISFDFLLLLYPEEILGEKHAERFGAYFPIRFDFLDTVEGEVFPFNVILLQNIYKHISEKKSHRMRLIISWMRRREQKFIWVSRRISIRENSEVLWSKATG